MTNDPHALLLEMTRAILPLKVKGTPITVLDSRLRKAHEAACRYFYQKGVHIQERDNG